MTQAEKMELMEDHGYYYNFTLWNGLAILDIENGIEDYALTAFYTNDENVLHFGRADLSIIHNSPKMYSYIIKNGIRYDLDDFAPMKWGPM